jgi:TetR/AcrR family transcriptional regulator, transcriptional repressor for nem operon
MARKSENARDRILDAAESLIMGNGFAGTSIDEILKHAGLTKGAFFHYFKGKGDLARELIERHAREDMALFEEWAAQSEARSDDPLEQTLLFLEMFEAHVSRLTENVPGCIYATYTHEGMQFDPSIRGFVADTLRYWTSIYARKFQEVLDLYRPALPVTARQLAEMIVSVIEGGFVLARAYDDVRMTARQSEQFRNYLELLFADRKGKAGKRTTRRTGERVAAEHA